MNINNVYIAKIFVKAVEDLNENYLWDHKGFCKKCFSI